MLCLGRSRGQNPWGLRPLRFWPWDLPRHNIHHDTSSAFSNNVPLCQVGLEQLLYRAFSRLGLDTAGAVASAVVFVLETLGQPSAAGRHLCSKLMFELYSVPGYGVDCLNST